MIFTQRPCTTTRDVLTKRLLSRMILCGLSFAVPVAAAAAPGAVVHALLFYSPTCSSCEKLRAGTLPVIEKRYGAQLQITQVNIWDKYGYLLYTDAVDELGIPQQREGIPTIILGDRVLVGEKEISEALPGLVDEGLARGGVPWPKLELFVPPTPGAGAAADSLPSLGERIRRDPVGNSLPFAVLAAMAAAVIFVGLRTTAVQRLRTFGSVPGGTSALAVTLLAVAGFAISAYLTFVELGGGKPFCPIGNCDAVQSSSFARVGGVVPLGVIGATGYAAILLTFTASRFSRSIRLRLSSHLVLAGLVAAGFVFSVYLTVLQPLVIGSTCLWCLASAAVMTALFVVVGKDLPQVIASAETTA